MRLQNFFNNKNFPIYGTLYRTGSQEFAFHRQWKEYYRSEQLVLLTLYFQSSLAWVFWVQSRQNQSPIGSYN